LEKQFLQIVRNKVSRDERSAFFAELEKDSEKKKAFMAFQKLWVVNNMAHHHNSFKELRDGFEQFWNQTHQVHRIRFWQMVSSVAATLLLGLIITRFALPGLWTGAPETMVFSAPKGNISQVTLKDGSTIWLNSSSKATITTYANRKVKVALEGEAFFDVIHDDSREFLVQTGNYQLLDRGTRFNVNYNKDNQQLTTALLDGAIEFRRGEQVLLKDLKPGTMFEFNMLTRTVHTSMVDSEFVTAWKDGKFVIVNKTLGEIAKELEEWYDVQFVFKEKRVKEQVFSGVIKRRTSMEHLLKVLKLSSKMDYTIENKEDGGCIIYFE
jgi:ferric-dicitrate binding protein FerR (iron transport regulator)